MSAALDDTDDRAESIRMIRDSAAAVAPPGGDTKRVRDLRFKDPGFGRGTLRQMGEMGWIGLRVPEERGGAGLGMGRSQEHTSELQSRQHLVCRLLLEKKHTSSTLSR